jgi:hypothetical protein
MRVAFVDNILLERSDDRAEVVLQPHLGLIALIAALRAGGHEGLLYDPKIAIERGDLALGAGVYDAIAERVAALDADVVGFTSLGCNFASTIKIARALRRLRPSTPIVLGGPHATILDREILERYDVFDAIVRGEADRTIAALANALDGRASLGTVAGVTYRDAGTVVRSSDAPAVDDLDALPFPAYDAYPIRELGLEMLAVDAGRGCPFHCTFCSTATFFGRRYRLKSSARLVDELDRLQRDYGVHRFTLNHDLFTVDKRKVRAFCAAVADRGYTWSCSARMDCVDDALLAEMATAGCNAIYYGVETGSRRLQRVVEKNLDLDLFHPRVAASLAVGMRVTASLITGYPNETRADREETLALLGESVERYGPELDLQLHLLTPEPGTSLHNAFAETLAYDGNVTDFTFPAIEPDDAALAASDPVTFVCHHFYDAGLPRDENLAIVAAYRTLASLHRAVLRALARACGSFVDLVTAFARFALESPRSPAQRLAAFVDARLGAAHPLADVVRFASAAASLRPEDRPFVVAPAADEPIVLARSVRPLGLSRDARAALERLEAADDEKELAAMPRAPQLLLGAHDLRGYDAFPVDTVTAALAEALLEPTTLADLRKRFAPVEVDGRVAALCLVGAVVAAGPLFARRRADDEADGDLKAALPGLRPREFLVHRGGDGGRVSA